MNTVHFKEITKCKEVKVGEIVLAANSEDPSLIPSTHTSIYSHLVSTVPGDASGLQEYQAYMCKQTKFLDTLENKTLLNSLSSAPNYKCMIHQHS